MPKASDNLPAHDPTERNGQATVHHVGARMRRGRPPVKIQLNLTSMIDVIFQLLLYFIITANFTADEGVLSAKLPQGSSQPQHRLKLPPEPLNIVLESAGDTVGCRILLQNRMVGASFTDLFRELARLQNDPDSGRHGAFGPDDPLIIRPGELVRWQHVVNAFNAALRAQYTNVSFAQAH